MTNINILLEFKKIRINKFTKKNLPQKTSLVTNDVGRMWSVTFSFHRNMLPTIQNVTVVRVLNLLTDKNLEVICELITLFCIMIEMDSAVASYTLG